LSYSDQKFLVSAAGIHYSVCVHTNKRLSLFLPHGLFQSRFALKPMYSQFNNYVNSHLKISKAVFSMKICSNRVRATKTALTILVCSEPLGTFFIVGKVPTSPGVQKRAIAYLTLGMIDHVPPYF